MKTITVEIRHAYGNTRYYPACRDSRLFAKLTGTTTLTKGVLQLITKLGYHVEYVYPTLNPAWSNS